jgi:hypothetical protein
MTRFVSLLSDAKKDSISKLRYSKKWALNVNCLSGARIAVDGTVACSSILNDVENRGDIGWGAFLNSSVGTGIPPTCKTNESSDTKCIQCATSFLPLRKKKGSTYLSQNVCSLFTK